MLPQHLFCQRQRLQFDVCLFIESLSFCRQATFVFMWKTHCHRVCTSLTLQLFLNQPSGFNPPATGCDGSRVLLNQHPLVRLRCVHKSCCQISNASGVLTVNCSITVPTPVRVSPSERRVVRCGTGVRRRLDKDNDHHLRWTTHQ